MVTVVRRHFAGNLSWSVAFTH